MIRIMQIKEQILKETGLKVPPNMTGVVISKNPALQKLIRTLNQQNQEAHTIRHEEKGKDTFGDDPNIKKEKVFVPASKGPSWVKLPEGSKLQYFKLGNEHSSSVAVANLHIWLKPLTNNVPKNNVAHISILKVERAKFPHDLSRFSTINSGVTVPYDPNGTWASIDAFSLVRQWLDNPDSNLGFIINATTVDGYKLGTDFAEDDPSHAPLLELDVKEERNERRKRFVKNRICSEKKHKKECCRYPLIVDFTENDYDFIVAPKKYVANFCRGDCPFLYAHKLPHTTILQQMYPNANSTLQHGPCCGARDLSALKMVYYDGHKIEISVINDMVVNQCSCG